MNYSSANTVISLSFVKGIGPAFFKKNLPLFERINGNAVIDNIKEFLDISKKTFQLHEIEEVIQQGEDVLSLCENNGIEVLSIGDKDYPRQLLELKDPPPAIYYKGRLSNLKDAITIIGTREPNKNGEIIAERLASYYTQNNWSICNGLAEGIDTFAVKYGNDYFSKSIGVLGGGLNYTNSKTLLKGVMNNADKILENNGIIISEMQPNKKEDTFSVIKSCRIQAGIGIGLILVQSSKTGGSKYTIKSFAELNRVLGVINPIKQDYEHESFSANRLLVEKGVMGLAELTDNKIDKIITNNVFPIKSKDDYAIYENLLSNSSSNSGNPNLLFK
jgi:predicted Rossmann fold nucleotide-binding protein DprA/Smf involved in DNA uptake